MENTQKMCPGIVRFSSFTLPVIIWKLCVRSHTSRDDPMKKREIIYCNVKFVENLDLSSAGNVLGTLAFG